MFLLSSFWYCYSWFFPVFFLDCFFFFKQKTAYELRISDWSSDVCSSDLLFELDMEKQRFLRHVSHELKTPLTAIREGSELLSDEIGGPLTAQQREIAGILRENSLRLQKMIENLLHYTAVQYRKPELKIEPVELSGTMEDVLANYALTLKTKQIRILREFQPIRMNGDQEKLRTVMDNLLSNAVKYTPPNGRIRIGVKQEERAGIIEVHDGGPGVMAADRAKLFDPFY